MRSPFSWGLVAVAAIAAAVAIWTRSNTGLALAAASVALLAAVLIFVEVGIRTWSPFGRVAAPSSRNPLDVVREAFDSGRLGRESVVALLDRLYWTSLNPDRPMTTIEQLDSIARMSPAEFREYVRVRVEYLEARS